MQNRAVLLREEGRDICAFLKVGVINFVPSFLAACLELKGFLGSLNNLFVLFSTFLSVTCFALLLCISLFALIIIK